MKTRYKIFLVIACFVSFYFAIIPVTGYCMESGSDCTLHMELIHLTRPAIAVDTFGDGISQWSGTVEGIEHTSMADQIMHNMPFVASMIVLPSVVIGLILVWDKRK
ncbi:MAG: hypothetical protein K8Q89_10270 [Nitrosarchaeum sp.]|nr:hypothetical protein [Nitrosarchaeum sp.]